MRTITRIGKKNHSYFSPYLMGIKEREGVLCLGCIEDGKPVGAAAFMLDEGRTDLIHLFVPEEYRRCGIGTELLEAGIRIAQSAGIRTICAIFPPDEGLEWFFYSAGFLVTEGDSLCVMNTDELLSSKNIRRIKTGKDSDCLHPVSSLSKIEQERMLVLLKNEGISESSLPALYLDPDLSAVVIKHNQVVSVLLASLQKERCLIHYLCNTRNDEPDNLFYMIRHLANVIERKPEIMDLCFYSENEEILEFAEKLTEGTDILQKVPETKNAFLILQEDES